MNMKVLIIDDDRLIQLIAQDLIREIDSNIKIEALTNPEKAMNFIETYHPDIILLDIIMPKISGLKLLKEIRSISAYDNIQIIMLTSMDDRESFNKCFLYGADDFISKPINELEFAARFQAAAKTRIYASYLEETNLKISEQHNELIMLYKKLQDTQFHIVQKEKMASLGELAAGIAHEINNPISFISSNLQTTSIYLKKLLQNSATQEIKDKLANEIFLMLEDSAQGIERISRIVGSLRLFARTGYEEMERELIDLNLLVGEAAFILKPKAEQNNISIIHCADNASYVLCNRYDIGQVILSIVTNSINALEKTQNDHKQLIMSTFSENNYACIRISDNGPGIPEELKSRIFDPFFTTSEVGSGLGLGLSISYDIITNKHNGMLNLEEENPYFPEGASFLICLPKDSEASANKKECHLLA